LPPSEHWRFARVFQFTLNPFLRGTPELRQLTREALAFPFGSLGDRLLFRLDQAVNATGRHFVTVEYHANMDRPGLASPAGISLSSAATQGPGVGETIRHEGLGHLSDFYLIDNDVRQWFAALMGQETWQPVAWEQWAEAVRQWAESDGVVWSVLTPILLP
jgi:hypothetical protein